MSLELLEGKGMMDAAVDLLRGRSRLEDREGAQPRNGAEGDPENRDDQDDSLGDRHGVLKPLLAFDFRVARPRLRRCRVRAGRPALRPPARTGRCS